MLNSRFTPLCDVSLPYAGRQHYMHAFDLADPSMAAGFEDYLEPVRALVAAAGVCTGTAYMTVDEKVIEAGASQRAPRPHVDGCFDPQRMSWTHEGPRPGAWAHGVARMPVIVASSVAGCRVFVGDFDAVPTDRGDLSHAQDILGEGIVVPAGRGFLLSADCVHESIPFATTTQRSFLRIALPVGSVSIQ